MVVDDFIEKRERARHSLVEKDLDRAIIDVIDAKDAERAVNRLLSKTIETDEGTPDRHPKAGFLKEAPHYELSNSKKETERRIAQAIIYGIFSSFQEGELEVFRRGRDLKFERKVDPSGLWGVNLLEGKVSSVFTRAFGKLVYDKIPHRVLYCTSFVNGDGNLVVLGAGFFSSDSSGRNNVNSFGLIFEKNQISSGEYFLSELRQNPQETLIKRLNEIFKNRIYPLTSSNSGEGSGINRSQTVASSWPLDNISLQYIDMVRE